MDSKTKEILKLFDLHVKIKNLVTFLCYFLIISGIFIYIFHAINQTNKVKLVNKFKDDAKSYKTKKIMTNPKIKFRYNDSQIYDIQAKQASHKDNEQVTLTDVFATGAIGNITAGELNIDEEGDHLVFTKNPILILNKTKQ